MQPPHDLNCPLQVKALLNYHSEPLLCHMLWCQVCLKYIPNIVYIFNTCQFRDPSGLHLENASEKANNHSARAVFLDTSERRLIMRSAFLRRVRKARQQRFLYDSNISLFCKEQKPHFRILNFQQQSHYLSTHHINKIRCENKWRPLSLKPLQ